MVPVTIGLCVLVGSVLVLIVVERVEVVLIVVVVVTKYVVLVEEVLLIVVGVVIVAMTWFTCAPTGVAVTCTPKACKTSAVTLSNS
jgi:hypothetical protein